MFEIRVICDPTDTDHVVAALDRTFTVGTVTVWPTRDRKQHRLYARAEHRSEPESWPTPEDAYALAPSIISEIGWTTRTVAGADCFTELEREFYLRKAALLDRIALLDEPDEPCGDAEENALAAATYLLDIDQAHPDFTVPDHAAMHPRGYVRQQYAAWHQHEQRSDHVTPDCR
ncbi:hypothetical protein [Streptomyces sp. HD]|uniref:hypothetical protein n=1 Tax=Streptomyces sp. HD TaxID=3020892 RepID=UPI00232DC03E|nr:hypothetical protein [Streptomyces sp. HD]MDC0774034.1 hypothetical protein [Streptomyces sp. HD]